MNKMKSLFTALLLLFALVCQAKRVIERPYFAGSNNHRIEIERVTLDKRATLVDVKIYQFGGEVGIDPRASITADGTTYAYTGSTQLPKGEFVKVPECGYVAATLRFKPMPESTQEFDFREVPDDSGWNNLWSAARRQASADKHSKRPGAPDIRVGINTASPRRTEHRQDNSACEAHGLQTRIQDQTKHRP